MAAIVVATNGVGSHVGVKRLVATRGHDRDRGNPMTGD